MAEVGNEVLVSVIMIFRNEERFLEEAILSVLGQTYQHFELLLCDDGSTDTSSQTALQWMARQPDRVRYLDHEGHAHRGMSSTRNLGIAAARGDLVAFLDADDVWIPEHLCDDVELLAKHPAVGLLCGQAEDWYSWADPAAKDVRYPLPWPPGVVVPPPRMLLALLARPAFRTPMCNLLVRKAALTAVGGCEDQFRSLYEDQVLLAKLFLSYSAVISGSRTSRYRKHSESATAQATRSGVSSFGPNINREAFLRWMDALLRTRCSDQDQEVRELLDRALEPYADRAQRARWRAVSVGRQLVPAEWRPPVRRLVNRARSLGLARAGYLRRLVPLSRQFGSDRGLPIDRFYIERFLEENAQAISGRVLEVGDSTYTKRFGGPRVHEVDVLNIAAGDPQTTIVADLARADHIADDSFDCLVITQTLHLIYDISSAVATLSRIVRPGGTVLATFPGISPLSSDRWAETWYWALTPLSAARLFGDAFGAENVEIASCGNVLTSVAFLEGLAAHELHASELKAVDKQFPMLITVRAQCPATGQGRGEPR